MSGRVLVLGSLNVDVVTRVHRHPAPGETVLGDGLQRFAGGKGGNQAVAASAAGARVAFAGAVGSDDAGAAYRRRLADLGIDVAALVTVDGPSGHALVQVDEGGENSIVVIPGANAAVNDAEGSPAMRAVAELAPGDVLLMQLEVPLTTVAAAARLAAQRGARVVINAAPFAELPAETIAVADPLIVNESEAALLARSGVRPGSLLVTAGSGGSTWGEIHVPAEVVAPDHVRDTTGAGDAYCGAFAAALARGAGAEEAMRAASHAGAEAVRRIGAQPHPELD